MDDKQFEADVAAFKLGTHLSQEILAKKPPPSVARTLASSIILRDAAIKAFVDERQEHIDAQLKTERERIRQIVKDVLNEHGRFALPGIVCDEILKRIGKP